MQIPPSTSLLHALSRSTDPVSTQVARKATGNEAARAAARAVFAQIAQTPAVSAPRAPSQAVAGQGIGHGPAQMPAVQNTAPVLPETPPTKPMPRGSIVNILV